MAEDITARILLSVEYADAVQKCKDVEVGITEVTEARERDVEVTKTTKSTSTSNARALEKEAEAANKVARATKRKNEEQRKTPKPKATPERGLMAWEAFGFASEKEYEEWAHPRIQQNELYRNEYNKRFDKAAERDWQKNIASTEEARAAETPKDIENRNKATEAIQERLQVMREVKHNTEVLRNLDDKALDEQIAKQKIKNAEIQRELALKKLINAQNERNSAEINLRDPEIQNNPVELQKNQALYDKYTREIEANRDAVFNAERNFRQANKSLDELGKTSSKSTSIFRKAAQGISRSLSSIARIGGRGMGMEIPTEGLQGPGAAFIAGSAAIAGVSMLVRNAMQFRDTEENAEYDIRQREIANLKETTERIAAETAKRKQGIDTLNEFTQKEELTNSERLKQAQILKDLNYALEGMRVNVDATSGRILNMGEIGWQVKERDTNREIEQLEREKKKQQQEIDIQNELEKPGFGSEFTTRALLSTIPGGNAFITEGGLIFDSIKGAIGKAWDNTFDREATLRREQKKQNAQDEILSIQEKQDEKKKSINEIAREKYWKDQNAGIETRIKKMKEASQDLAYASNANGDAWKIRQRELEKYSEKDLKALQEKTSDKVWAEIQSMPKKTIEDQEKYNKALSEYNENMLQRQHIEQKRAAYAAKEREIQRTIDDLRDEISLQDMINSGKSKEADITRKTWEMEKKVSREGWSPEQAKEWAKLRAQQEDKAARAGITRSIGNIVGSESFKIRQTSTAAVMANSLEAAQLQSRQLIANTPDQKLLQETQQQSKTLENTLKAIEKVYNALSNGIRINTKKV